MLKLQGTTIQTRKVLQTLTTFACFASCFANLEAQNSLLASLVLRANQLAIYLPYISLTTGRCLKIRNHPNCFGMPLAGLNRSPNVETHPTRRILEELGTQLTAAVIISSFASALQVKAWKQQKNVFATWGTGCKFGWNYTEIGIYWSCLKLCDLYEAKLLATLQRQTLLPSHCLMHTKGSLALGPWAMNICKLSYFAAHVRCVFIQWMLTAAKVLSTQRMTKAKSPALRFSNCKSSQNVRIFSSSQINRWVNLKWIWPFFGAGSRWSPGGSWARGFGFGPRSRVVACSRAQRSICTAGNTKSSQTSQKTQRQKAQHKQELNIEKSVENLMKTIMFDSCISWVHITWIRIPSSLEVTSIGLAIFQPLGGVP